MTDRNGDTRRSASPQRAAARQASTPGKRGCIGASVSAAVLGFLLAIPSGHAQTASPPPAAQGAVAPSAPLDARTMTCQALQARVRDSEPIFISSGPQGGDLFYARNPRCEFWQRPQSSFVRAQDGWCGAGFICAAKFQGSP